MARVKHTKAEKIKIRRRRARQFRGAVFLLLAFVGVISIASVVIGRIRAITNDDVQKAEFAKIIAPLVALDPAPFESTEKAKAAILEEAAIRAVIYNENTSKYVRTSEGQILIPVLDVDRYYKRLFGSGRLPRHVFISAPSGSTPGTWRTLRDARGRYLMRTDFRNARSSSAMRWTSI